MMLRAQRLCKITELLSENSGASVAALSELLQVSESTIRRDLRDLSMSGQVLRTHGGALSVEGSTSLRLQGSEMPVTRRESEHTDEKARIGRAAAELVQDGETVFLGSGSTTWQVARNLGERKRLTIITNAVNIATLFASRPDVTVIIVGGLLRHSELSIIGHIAEQTLREFRADKVIMGITAISADAGLMNSYLPETVTDRSIISIAPQVIIVADHEKLGKVSTSFVAPISAVDILVTGVEADAQHVEETRQAGTKVILA